MYRPLRENNTYTYCVIASSVVSRGKYKLAPEESHVIVTFLMGLSSSVACKKIKRHIRYPVGALQRVLNEAYIKFPDDISVPAGSLRWMHAERENSEIEEASIHGRG